MRAMMAKERMKVYMPMIFVGIRFMNAKAEGSSSREYFCKRSLSVKCLVYCTHLFRMEKQFRIRGNFYAEGDGIGIAVER